MSNHTERYRSHTNLEAVRQCPYCDAKPLSRGLHVHVMNSEDDDHGPRGEVPDGFSVEDAEIVDRKEVTVEKPTKYSVDHHRLVCDYCGQTFKGELGIQVHLDRKAGEDDLHPGEAVDRDLDTFERFPATEDGKIIVTSKEEAEGIDHSEGVIVADEATIAEMESDVEKQAMVPLGEIEQLYLKFVDDSQNDRDMTAYHAAERVDALIQRYRQEPEGERPHEIAAN